MSKVGWRRYMDKIETKEKPKIALFRSLINISFNKGLTKWKVLANPKELVISKDHNLISMYVNPKTQMFSLKFDSNKDLMGIDPSRVDAIILGKDKLTIIGDFDGNKPSTDKKGDITLS